MIAPFLTRISAPLVALMLITGCAPQTGTQDSPPAPALCVAVSAPFAYSYCHIEDSAAAQIQLFWQNDNNDPLLTFDNLRQRLPDDHLLFAMNAGMYDHNFAPIGYTVIDHHKIKSLNVKQGGGNFHLLPNGVFWQDDTGKNHVTKSQVMADKLDDGVIPRFATQSGPMLVIDGNIHPKLNKNGSSKKIRNGVGVCADGTYFVISDEPVNFYDFATLFKEGLNCPNALFLDGGIASALYAPDLDRHDAQQMGVMVGAVQVGQ